MQEIKKTKKRRFKDLTGSVFGKLTVVKLHGYTFLQNYRVPLWECECECGNYRLVKSAHLKRKAVKACIECGRTRKRLGQQFAVIQ